MNAFDFMLRNWREILALTGEHVWLVAVSTTIAVAVGIPVGLVLTRRASLKRPVLAVANVLQTVPSLALFGFLIPLPLVGGIGARAAIVALVLSALLPVMRNTVTGVEGVERSVREAAVAMGMTDAQILRQVELPLAAPVILAGVRVATVISVGVATIAAAIGAGGLGTYIFRGLRQYDNNLILAGAVPAALLALAADAGLGLLESRLDVRTRVARSGRKGSAWPRRAAWAAVAVALVSVGAFSLWRRAGRAGFGQDFMSRKDGYEGFARAYDLRFAERPREMDLSLSYRALASGEVDVIAGNSTDGMIAALGLTQLADDRHYFPPYEAVVLSRRDALSRLPQMREVIQKLAGAVTTDEMRRLNFEVDGNKRPAADVVREWRGAKGF